MTMISLTGVQVAAVGSGPEHDTNEDEKVNAQEGRQSCGWLSRTGR